MTRHRLAKGTLAAVTAALLLTACGGDNPDTLLASARDYLAKNDAKAAVIQIKNVLQKRAELGRGALSPRQGADGQR